MRAKVFRGIPVERNGPHDELVGLERIVVTPGEHGERVVRAFVERATASDADGMLALVAPDARIHFVRAENPGLGIDVIEQGVRLLERRYTVRSNSITRLRGTTTADGTGEVVLACLTDVDGGYAATPHGWTIEVAERGGSWLIVRMVFRSVAGRDPSLRMLAG